MDDMAFSPPADQSIQTLKSKGVEDDTREKKNKQDTLKTLKMKSAIFFPISDKTTIVEEKKVQMKCPRGNERTKVIPPNALLLINACFTDSVHSQWRRLSALTVEESLEEKNTNFLENTGLQRGN